MAMLVESYMRTMYNLVDTDMTHHLAHVPITVLNPQRHQLLDNKGA